MIDAEELAICRRRGHEPYPRPEWQLCKWCGMWLRTITSIEEREAEPPDGAKSPLEVLRKLGAPPAAARPKRPASSRKTAKKKEGKA